MASRNALLDAAYAVLGRPKAEYKNTMLPDYYDQSLTQHYPQSAGEAVGGGILGTILDYGPLPAQLASGLVEDVFVGQPKRAANAIGETIEDPSIPNAANAAFQTGMALWRPGKALGALGAGYLGTLAEDSGAFDWSANADPYKQKPLSETPLPESGRIPRAENALQASQEHQRDQARFEAELERERAAAVAAAQAKASAEAASAGRIAEADAETKRAEYDAQVRRAEQARDVELGRDTRFSDTQTGKLFEMSGGAAPFIAGAGMGALRRLARAPVETGNLSVFGRETALPKQGLKTFGEGATAGITATNLPLAYNAFFTEPDNPEKRAYAAYSRELPQGHPRKQEYADYAASLPLANPVREAAANELYDPLKFGERAIMGTVEGGTGAFAGKYLASLPRSTGSAVNEMLAYRLPKGRRIPTLPVRNGPQSPTQGGSSGTPATQPVGPVTGQPGPQPGPQPVPPRRPPATGQTGGGGSGVQQPSGKPLANRKKEILDEMVAGTAQPSSKQEQNYINILTKQAEGLGQALGISTEDALRAMNDTIKSGARNTPYAIPAAVAAGAASDFDFNSELQNYGMLVRDMDGDGDIDAQDLALMQQRGMAR